MGKKSKRPFSIDFKFVFVGLTLGVLALGVFPMLKGQRFKAGECVQLCSPDRERWEGSCNTSKYLIAEVGKKNYLVERLGTLNTPASVPFDHFDDSEWINTPCVLEQTVEPRFAPGDCVSIYGRSPFKIYSINDGAYFVALDATCTAPSRIECRGSSPAYNIENVDKHGVKVTCPTEDRGT